MVFDDHFFEIVTKLLIALLLGALVGAEREYRNKTAGLRTMILICVGSAVYTIISIEVSHATEIGRIASNVVTGIGFLGAGAILRDGMSVAGLTTASTIWIVAAFGMSVGAGEYRLAITACLLTLVVLVAFSYIQTIFDKLRRVITLTVVFKSDDGVTQLEKKMGDLRISFDRKKEYRKDENIRHEYEIATSAKKLQSIIRYLIDQKHNVKSFDY